MSHKEDAIKKGNELVLKHIERGSSTIGAIIAAIVTAETVLTALHHTTKQYSLYRRTLIYLNSREI